MGYVRVRKHTRGNPNYTSSRMSSVEKNNVIEAVERYLSSKFGILLSFFSENQSSVNEIRMKSTPLPTNSLGITRYMIKEIRIKVHGFKDKDGNWILTPEFDYDHHGGGSNAHNFNFKLIYYKDGIIVEHQM